MSLTLLQIYVLVHEVSGVSLTFRQICVLVRDFSGCPWPAFRFMYWSDGASLLVLWLLWGVGGQVGVVHVGVVLCCCGVGCKTSSASVHGEHQQGSPSVRRSRQTFAAIVTARMSGKHRGGTPRQSGTNAMKRPSSGIS